MFTLCIHLIHLICVGFNLGELINLLENSFILSVFIHCSFTAHAAQAGQSLALLTKDDILKNVSMLLFFTPLTNKNKMSSFVFCRRKKVIQVCGTPWGWVIDFIDESNTAQRMSNRLVLTNTISAQIVNLVDLKVTTTTSYSQCFIFILPPPTKNTWLFLHTFKFTSGMSFLPTDT